jgi:hypothetical protein
MKANAVAAQRRLARINQQNATFDNPLQTAKMKQLSLSFGETVARIIREESFGTNEST